MNKITLNGLMAFALGLMSPQITPAQGTITYLSNLGTSPGGSAAAGSDSWVTIDFRTGTNAGGYVLNSVELAMTDASGNPSGFTTMLYGARPSITAIQPGSSLGTLDGSLNPVASGIYTYTPASNLMLSPSTAYFIVLTAGTTVANGAYEWSLADAFPPSLSGGWSGDNFFLHSSDGSSWSFISGAHPQFAINAAAVPEPGVLSLLGLGGLSFLWQRRKARAI